MKKLIKFIKNLFSSTCPNCEIGKISYAGDDWTGRVWVSIKKCDHCKKEFI